jgi:hypothetical protein
LNRLEATHAFLFPQRADQIDAKCLQSAVQSHAWSSMFGGSKFTDHIMLTILETYEAYQQATR